MTGRHSGLGWPGAIGDHAREATAPPYIGRHRRTPVELAEDAFADLMFAADPSIRPRGWTGPRDPRRCEDCGHLEDRCECPHDCSYPEDTDD